MPIDFNKLLILDGATGTELMKRGMPAGVVVEEWVLDNPDILKNIQREYVQNGSMAVYAPTFGANRIKLKNSALKNDIYGANMRLLSMSKEAVGENALIGGDLSPTGEFLSPIGSLSESQLINAYREQVQAFHDFGVDFIVVETMMDIREVKCALLACDDVYKNEKKNVFVTVTLEKNGKTLSGTNPLTALLISQFYGADAFGINCSYGPDAMLEIFREQLLPYSIIPLIAKPNAGLPIETEQGLTFSMTEKEFARNIKKLVEAGVSVIGGCCGTTPEYIKAISDFTKSKNFSVSDMRKKTPRVASSVRKSVEITDDTVIAKINFTNDSDIDDIYDKILDSEAEVIELVLESCDDKKLLSLLDTLNMTVFTPIIFNVRNAEKKTEQVEFIKRNYTYAE